jgi:hypothetical protein
VKYGVFKKTDFHGKTRKNAARMYMGSQGTGAGAGLISGSRKKTGYHLLFRCSLDLNPFPGLHVMDVLGNLAGMVGTPFKVPGDHDVVRAARDIFRIFHHVGNPFPEDRVPEGIDCVITG